MYQKLCILYTIIFAFQQVYCFNLKFTNIVCKSEDPTFVEIVRCQMKAVSRTINYFTVKAEVLQLPVTDMTVRFQIMKKASGWKPFLYDFTVRCNFTKHLNPLTNLVWKIVRDISNIQHDCPYNQSIEVVRVDNVVIAKSLQVLPVPSGEYAVFTTWKAYNVTRAIANFFVTIS